WDREICPFLAPYHHSLLLEELQQVRLIRYILRAGERTLCFVGLVVLDCAGGIDEHRARAHRPDILPVTLRVSQSIAGVQNISLTSRPVPSWHQLTRWKLDHAAGETRVVSVNILIVVVQPYCKWIRLPANCLQFLNRPERWIGWPNIRMRIVVPPAYPSP